MALVISAEKCLILLYELFSWAEFNLAGFYMGPETPPTANGAPL